MKLKFYCDSGANIHSNREEEFEFEDLGIDREEWDEMSNDDRNNMVEEWAWNSGLALGWEEV